MVINPKSKNSANVSEILGFMKRNIIDRNMAVIRYGCLLATIACASTQTSTTQAFDLDNFLGGMYSNTTDAGYFNTQQRGVISGGGYVGRFAVKPIQLVSFDPPRISAGCGGINLFGGSFSFINAAELTQLLRTIAQNALGLLFHLGLNAISQPLSSLLNTWSKKLQDMNSLLKNSCEAARKLFQMDTSGSTLSSLFGSQKNSVETSTGEKQDYFSSVKSNFQQGWKELTNSGGAQTTATKEIQKIDKAGNVTWRALNASDSYKAIQSATGTSNDEAKTLLMNLIGTEIFDTTEKPQNCGGGSGNCEPKMKTFYPIMTFDDLKSPSATRDTFFACSDGDNTENADSCKDPKYTRLSTIFRGTAHMVNMAFYGINSSEENLDPAVIQQAISEGKGIVGKSMVANATLTADEQRMLQAMPQPIVAYLNKLRGEPSQMLSLSVQVKSMVIEDMTVKLATALANAAEATFNGKEVEASPPQGFQTNLVKFRKDIADHMLKTNERMDQDVKLYNWVNIMQNSQYYQTMPVSK